MTTRRDSVRASAGAGVGVVVGVPGAVPERAPYVLSWQVVPVAIASSNGQESVARALEVIIAGRDTLDAVVEGVNIVERDPEDTSAGYGGLRNAEEVVQLDSSFMRGPTRGAGAVAALEGIKAPSLAAMDVPRYTDHVLLVG